MTVRDNVAFGLTIRKRPKAEIASKVDDLLEIVGLDGFQHRYPAQLSGGQRQRMALARALAVDPEVLLLDEPFGALDAKVRADLRQWLRRLHDEVHVTTVLVTHDQEEALDVADRIAVLNKGRIEQVGDPVTLYDRPANDFVMSFLGSVARLGGQLVRPHDIALDRDRATALPPMPAWLARRASSRRRGAGRPPRLRGARRPARRHGRAVRRPDHPRRGRRAGTRAGETVFARASRSADRPRPSPPSPSDPSPHRAIRGGAGGGTMRAWTSRRARTTPSGRCSSSRRRSEGVGPVSVETLASARACRASSSRRSSPTCAPPGCPQHARRPRWLRARGPPRLPRRRLPRCRRPARGGAGPAAARDGLRGRGPAPAHRLGRRPGQPARGPRRTTLAQALSGELPERVREMAAGPDAWRNR